MADVTEHDEQYMRRALKLAERGRGSVEPNPVVGCVLVRDGRIVGEGYHRRYGGPHAEVWALRAAGPTARGATAYVTLEPCCHYGKTPPCTDALIAAGVRRVVAALRDPFPRVAGQGLQQLRAAGIEVSAGLCEAQAIRLNGPYLKRQRLQRPWVTLKWAQSLDGKIATRTGDSKWISGEASRAWAHRLRGRMDAIVVGIGTVLADDPLLTCRHGKPRRVAVRLVLDRQLRTPVRSQLARTARDVPTIVVTDRAGSRSTRARALARTGMEVLAAPARGGELDLAWLLDELGRRGMSNVMVEGGGRTLGSFFDAGLADEAVVFVSRRLIGGREAVSPLAGRGPARMDQLASPAGTTVTRMGSDDLYRVVLTDPVNLVQSTSRRRPAR